MGLLDQFSNLTPDQTQGLLAAASQMLQQSGPSRTPVGFGQILGGGLSSYQAAMDAARQKKMQEDQARQMAQMRGLQMQGMQGELADKDLARKQALDAQEFYRQYNKQHSTQQSPSQQPTAQLFAPQQQDTPNWMSDLRAGQQAAQSPMEQAQPRTNATWRVFNDRLDQAQAMRATGIPLLVTKADELEKSALAFQPKVKSWEKVMQGDHVYLKPYFEDGSSGDAVPAQVAEKLNFQNLGGKTVGLDAYTGAQRSQYGHTMSPDSAARLSFDRQKEAQNQDSALDPLSVHFIAQQVLAGDSSAMQNYGRGAQGARNLNAIRNEVQKMANANGMTGADLAAKNAEFFGIKAGQRTASTRSAGIEIAANEVAQLAPMALDASAKVARSGFLPFGKGQIMFDSNTNDPNMRQFAMANNALVNAYGQAMARGGTATVNDKQHAEQLLSTAMDQNSYAAAVRQLQLEIKAAQAAPKGVRASLSAAVSGRQEAATQGGQFSVQAPDGHTYSFKNAKDLANFKLEAGIR